MSILSLDDAREYVFPLLHVKADSDKNAVYAEDYVYLGTAFFVTKKGDAIASAHTIPSPDDLPPGRRLIAVIVIDGKQTPCWVNYVAYFDGLDLALVRVNLQNTKFLNVSFETVHNGVDVVLVGIPDHSVSGTGKEMRTLKGHVTLSGECLELSIPIHSGMSGSPVFSGTNVVAYAVGVARSEALEELIEEEITETKTGEKVKKRIEVKRVIHYGIARPFSILKDMRHPALENRTLGEFIENQNREP
jgi:hypothetical protein